MNVQKSTFITCKEIAHAVSSCWIIWAGVCLCVCERTQSNWMYSTHTHTYLTIDMVRFLPLMAPIYALSTVKCAHFVCSLFALLTLFLFLSHRHVYKLTHQPIYIQTPVHSPRRRMCDSPKPNAIAVVATTELHFSLATISAYWYVYSVSQCFQCRRFANVFSHFFFFFFLYSRTHHHIT